MKLKPLALGLASFLLPLSMVFTSIFLSPWFSWMSNALSDLGHSVRSPVAPIFNFGLVTGGLLLLIYSVNYMSKRFPLTAKLVAVASYFLILIGTFDEVYGALHFIVSLIFFLALAIASLAYSFEGKSNYPVVIAVIIAAVWAIQLSGLCSCGAAIPEIISIFVTLVWFFDSMVKLQRSLKWD